MELKEAKQRFFNQLGQWKIMALGSSVNDYVMVRNVSCLFYNEKIFFKTDKNFRKTRQLLRNPHIAVCTCNRRQSGKQRIHDQCPGRMFQPMYKQTLRQSYPAYLHEENEILSAGTPEFVQIWDEDEQ